MKNVCFFNSTLFWGGGEKSHLEYAVNFLKHNYQVSIVTSAGSVLESKAKKYGLQVYTYKISNLSFLNPFKVNKLAMFFRSKNIDTLFLNSSPDLKLGGLAARKAGVKNIIYMRGLAVPVKSNALNRYLLTNVITHPVPNSLDTRKAFLTNLKPLLNDSNVPVIYRGINFEDWEQRSVSSANFRDKDEIIIGNVGRLVEQKGQHFLIDIAEKLKKKGLRFKLVIAGVGPLEEKLKLKVKQAQLEDDVLFPGFYNNIRDFLGGIDIFVFPSLWEGFGNAMVEAMYEQKPVVAFNRTSNPEIVENEKTGFLIDYPNLDEFAAVIYKLACEPKLRNEIGVAARKSVQQRFSFDTILKAWENLLD